VFRYVRNAAEKLFKEVQEGRAKREMQRLEARAHRGRAQPGLSRNEMSRKLYIITEERNVRANVRRPPLWLPAL
jgi:hypothetical protein